MKTNQPRPTVFQFLHAELARTGMSAVQIAEQTGVATGKHWQMVIDGRTKIPFSWIAPFCKATGADPAHMLRLFMNDYMPSLFKMMEELSIAYVLTANERRLIESLRTITADNDAEALVVHGRDLVAVVMV